MIRALSASATDEAIVAPRHISPRVVKVIRNISCRNIIDLLELG